MLARMKLPPAFTSLAGVLLATSSFAETVKDREGAVRGDKAAMENDNRWIYNDSARGFAEAKRTGKPLLVVLRCVPCLVLRGHRCAGAPAGNRTRAAARPIRLRARDQRQRARPLAVSSSTTTSPSPRCSSTATARSTAATARGHTKRMRRKNRPPASSARSRAHSPCTAVIRPTRRRSPASKAGRRRSRRPWRFPTREQIQARPRTGTARSSRAACIATRSATPCARLSREEKPMPVGVDLSVARAGDDRPHARRRSGRPRRGRRRRIRSPRRAGLHPGDDLFTLDGQPLLSIADVSWALHRAPDSGSIPAFLRRAGADATIAIALPPGWRSRADIGRRVGTWPMRGMALGGLKLDDLPDAARARRGINLD